MQQTMLIIDLQHASFERPQPVHDAAGLVKRISTLAARVRNAAGRVILVQFNGPSGSPYDPEQAGWELVPDLEITAEDVKFSRSVSDAFRGTDLDRLLGPPQDCNLIITGCDTEFCIDSTVRSALACNYAVTVPEDGHSLTDRPHLKALEIIEHHNAIWRTPGALAGPVTVAKCADIRI